MKNKRILSLLVVATMVITLLAGCGATSSYDKTAEAPAVMAENAAGSFGYSDGGDYEIAEITEDAKDADAEFGQKLVYTARMSIETLGYDDSVRLIKDAVSQYGAFIENTDSYNYSNSRSCSFTVRVPSDKYSEFISTVGDIGNVVSRSEEIEDITASYLDVEARLESLNAQMSRLEELRDKAETLNDLLAIEDKIENVQYQIESATAQLKYFNSQVSYSTVYINLDEVVVYTEEPTTFLSKVGHAISESARTFGQFLQGLVVFLIYAIPYFVLIGAVVILVISLVRESKKKKRNATKKNANAQTEKKVDTNNE